MTIIYLGKHLEWYNIIRIKASLNYCSSVEYREQHGYVA
ncbi:IS3 family transposase [Cloacibacillus evryensis]